MVYQLILSIFELFQVNFNEPLSMLQRLTEDLEYSDILDRAAACQSSLEQMCYVAAFTISSYSTTSHRTGKPFNPLLGETFECDRSGDRGWRSLAEQVGMGFLILPYFGYCCIHVARRKTSCEQFNS